MTPLTVGAIDVCMVGDAATPIVDWCEIPACAAVRKATSRTGSRLQTKLRRTHVPHDGRTLSTHLFRLS